MSLSFYERGSPSDPPFLFLHGLGASCHETVAVFSLLEGRRLIAPDLPGHGHSLDFDPAHFSFSFFADQIADLLDHLELETITLGGQCLGAGVALNFALRYPEYVRKLVLLRPAWLSHPRPRHLALFAKVGDWLQEGDEERTTMKLALHPAYQTLTKSCLAQAEEVTALLDRRKDVVSTQVLAKMWSSYPFEDLAELANCTPPTLVLSTSKDSFHPEEVSRTLASHLPKARLATLPPRYQEAIAYQQALTEQVESFLSATSSSCLK